MNSMNSRQLRFDYTNKIAFFNLGTTTDAMMFFSKQYNIPIIKDVNQIKFFKTILFSLLSFRDFYKVAEISQYKGNTEWIAGGNAVTNPTAIRWIMDYVFIGDCFYSFENIINGDRDLPGLLKCDSSDDVIYNQEKIYPFAYAKRDIFLSTGCRFKCFFCSITWRSEYQENDFSNIRDFVANYKGKSFYLVSSCPNSVSYYLNVLDVLKIYNKENICPSTTFFNLDDDFMKNKNSEFLFGIEGMSEKLRSKIRKPLRTDKLYEGLEKCFYYNKQVRTVFQFNLPGETEEDFNELMRDFKYIYNKYEKGSWAIPFIPHLPTSLTPSQWSKPYYNINMVEKIMAFRKEMFGSNKKGISVYVPSPLYPLNWFKQIISEYLSITPDLIKKLKSCKEKEPIENYSRKLDCEYIFEEHPFSYTFPWNNIKTKSNKEEMYKVFLAVTK